MDYKLSNPKRKRIFQQFLYNNTLRFNQIEKLTAIRSNELAYFIQKLVEEGVLAKKGESYCLSPQAERYIPFFVDADEKMSPLPVVLVACVDSGKVMLWKRKKRPYKEQWSLPGGRLRLSETIKQASLRILKEITFIDGKFESANAAVNEKFVEQDAVKHAFLIIFARASPLNRIKEKEDIKWFSIKKLPAAMIPSDKWLVQNKLESKIDLMEESITIRSGKLSIQFSENVS